MYVCIYVCMHACMHACIYIFQAALTTCASQGCLNNNHVYVYVYVSSIDMYNNDVGKRL